MQWATAAREHMGKQVGDGERQLSSAAPASSGWTQVLCLPAGAAGQQMARDGASGGMSAATSPGVSGRVFLGQRSIWTKD